MGEYRVGRPGKHIIITTNVFEPFTVPSWSVRVSAVPSANLSTLKSTYNLELYKSNGVASPELSATILKPSLFCSLVFPGVILRVCSRSKTTSSYLSRYFWISKGFHIYFKDYIILLISII